MPPADQLLAIVAIINALGTNIALIIHAFRVRYRESAAEEQMRAIDTVTRQRHQKTLDAVTDRE